MSRDISTFQAKCASCGEFFEHPSVGDQSYGEMIFCSTDGKHYAWVSAFSGFPQKLDAFLPESAADIFWDTLADLADPTAEKKFSTSLCCPYCSSNNLEFWQGKPMGIRNIPEVAFCKAMALDDVQLRKRIQDGSKS